MPFHRSLLCLTTLIVLCAPAAAQDANARLRLSALVEEARLLLDEYQTLEPVTRAVRAEDERLRREEKGLASESAQLAREIEEYNGAANELRRRSEEHRGRCPLTMSENTAIEACDARGAELAAQAGELDRRHAGLDAAQQDLHRRIALFNSSQQSWLKVRREHLPKLARNEADATQWVARASAFTATDAFAAMVAAAGDPGACEAVRAWSPPADPGIQGLRKLYACIAAVVPR